MAGKLLNSIESYPITNNHCDSTQKQLAESRKATLELDKGE